MYYVYILQSQKTNRHYIGYTSDLEDRFLRHNLGKEKSTKGYVPWKLVYTEKFDSRENAVNRERQIKSYKSGRELKKLLKVL